MHVRRFEHPTKNRYWEVYWEIEVEIVSGAIGSKGRATRRELGNPLACKQWVEAEIAKRIKEGFEEVLPEEVVNANAPQATPPRELLARILEAPDDDQPRMVLADWLQSQGDPLGELIAVQLEIARSESPPKKLRDREEALLVAFRPRWLPDVIGDVKFVRGFADSIKLELPFESDMLVKAVEHAPLLRTVTFGHPRDSWRWNLRRLFELAAPETLARFSGIWMGGFALDDDGLAAFAHMDLPLLDRLGMRTMQMMPAQFKKLPDRTWVELDLHANSLGARGLGFILERNCQLLEALDLGSNEIGNAGAQMLAKAHLPALKRLALKRSKIDNAGLRTLASAPFAPQLVSLDLSSNKITDESPLKSFTSLRTLKLAKKGDA